LRGFKKNFENKNKFQKQKITKKQRRCAMVKILKSFFEKYNEKRRKSRFEEWQVLEYVNNKTDLPPKWERRLMKLRKEFCSSN
jgi:hypothetical protein